MAKSWKMGANGEHVFTEDAPTEVASTNVNTNVGEQKPLAGNVAPTEETVKMPAKEVSTPSPVVTSTAARTAEIDNAKGYVRYAGSTDVFEKGTNRYIPYAEASANNIWNNIQDSTEARPAGVSTPIENIQKVFGQDWKPAPAITPELQAKGILGAVKIGNQVYTIGTGGHAVGAEEYKQLFGTDDQSGIVGQIDLQQAVGLGITPTQNDISSFNEKLVEDMYSVNSLGELSTKSEDITKQAYKKSDEMMTQINMAIQGVIDSLKNAGTDKAKAKAEEREALGMEEKDKAIANAQTAYSEHKNLYDVYINGLKNKGNLTVAAVGSMTAQANAQKAIELAPLEAAISIATGSYNRAKEQLDEWSDDYDTNYTHLLSAYQMNIDSLNGNLSYEQQKAKDQATQKLALLQASYDEMKSTQEDVKKLMLMYGQAGININDSAETAYEKVSPYIKSEAEFKKKSDELDLQIKQAQLSAAKKSKSSSGGSSSSGNSKVVTMEDGTKVDVTTVWGVEALVNAGYGLSDIATSLSKDYKLTQASIKSLVSGYIGKTMEGQMGNEGYVSYETYNRLKDDWSNVYGSTTNFDKTYSKYVNTKDNSYKKGYNLDSSGGRSF